MWDDDTLAWASMSQPVIDADTLNVSFPTPLSVTGTFFQATQPMSAASLPLPTGAATENTLAAIDANTDLRLLTTGSGSVTGIGNNTLLTPSSGKKLRLAYASYNPALAVEAGFRFGAAGTLFLRNSIGAGAVVAKDFGDMRYIEGAVDEALILNLSVGVATIWNALFTEV